MQQGIRSIAWTVVAAVALAAASAAPPVAAEAWDVDFRKNRIVERYGLDTADPAVRTRIDQAHALTGIAVEQDAEGIWVVLDTTGTPVHRGVIFEDRRRFVLDLYETLDVADGGPWELGLESPIRGVRHSQFQVQPDYISRIVCDLAADAEPEIIQEEGRLSIFVPAPGITVAPALTAAPEDAFTAEELAPAAPVVLDGMGVEELAPAEPAPDASDTTWWVDTDAPASDTTVPADVTPEPAAEDTTPWWTEEDPTGAASAPTDLAVDEPVVDELAPAAEPTRTDVDETVDTPSLPELTEPTLPVFEPVVVEEPAPVTPEPVLFPLDEPLLDEPLIEEPLIEEPAPLFEEEPPQVISPTAPVSPLADADLSPFEQTVTLTFRDADLNAVLDIIARKGRINILAGRDVSGTVTVRLVEVPMDVALDAVLNVNGYGYIKTNNIYRIVPLSQIGGDEVETITEAFHLSYAKANDIKGTMKSFLTRNGAIDVDERTNLVMVTDVPSAVARIADLIPQIDRRVQQSLIEVVILDSVLTDGADLGVQWNLFQKDDRTPGAIAQSQGFPFVNSGTLGTAGAVSTVVSSLQDGLGVNLPSATSGGAGMRLRFGTLIADFNLSAFIEAQVVNSDARVLANPKLLTLDNTTANIDIIEEIPFSDITQTSSGGQLSNISFKEVGTKLEVTPHITNDGYVILEIRPEQSSRIATTPTGVPIVATRRAQTTLLVQDHQTIVLGGLRINRSNLTRTKVPGLGDVPGVRLLFRSTSADEVDTEILLFLTTHIIESPPVMPHERLVYEELANTPRNPDVQSQLFR